MKVSICGQELKMFCVTLVSTKYTNPLSSNGKLEIDIEFPAFDLTQAQSKCELFKLHGFDCVDLYEIEEEDD